MDPEGLLYNYDGTTRDISEIDSSTVEMAMKEAEKTIKQLSVRASQGYVTGYELGYIRGVLEQVLENIPGSENKEAYMKGYVSGYLQGMLHSVRERERENEQSGNDKNWCSQTELTLLRRWTIKNRIKSLYYQNKTYKFTTFTVTTEHFRTAMLLVVSNYFVCWSNHAWWLFFVKLLYSTVLWYCLFYYTMWF